MSTQQIQPNSPPTPSQPGKFVPSTVTANAGDNLTWYNTDKQPHWPTPNAANKAAWFEAEWEYAARGGNPAARYGPLAEVAWYHDNSEGSTHPVGQKKPNGFGLYDTLGNVWEWVQDRYGQEYYSHSPDRDPPGPLSGEYRVARGGSWRGIARGLARVSSRYVLRGSVRSIVVGFRCAREKTKKLTADQR